MPSGWPPAGCGHSDCCPPRRGGPAPPGTAPGAAERRCPEAAAATRAGKPGSPVWWLSARPILINRTFVAGQAPITTCLNACACFHGSIPDKNRRDQLLLLGIDYPTGFIIRRNLLKTSRTRRVRAKHGNIASDYQTKTTTTSKPISHPKALTPDQPCDVDAQQTARTRKPSSIQKRLRITTRLPWHTEHEALEAIASIKPELLPLLLRFNPFGHKTDAHSLTETEDCL